MEKYGVKQDLTEEEEETFRKLAREGNKQKEGSSDDSGPKRQGNVLFDPDEGTRPFERKSEDVDSGSSGDKKREDE